MTKDVLILEALQARLRAILKVNGFVTDAGESVHLGEVDESVMSPYLASGIVAIEPGDVEVLAQGEAESEVLWQMPVKFLGTIQADLEDPIGPALALRSDIDRAVFGPADKTLGGLLVDDEGLLYGPGKRLIERKAGSKVVSVELDAVVKYTDTVGAPEAP